MIAAATVDAELVVGLPNSGEKIEADDIPPLVKAAEMFSLPRLHDVCSNWLSGEDFLNPSIGEKWHP